MKKFRFTDRFGPMIALFAIGLFQIGFGIYRNNGIDSIMIGCVICASAFVMSLSMGRSQTLLIHQLQDKLGEPVHFMSGAVTELVYKQVGLDIDLMERIAVDLAFLHERLHPKAPCLGCPTCMTLTGEIETLIKRLRKSHIRIHPAPPGE